MKKLTAAIVGLGARGFVYADIMKQLSDQIEIVACADINPLCRKLFCEQFNISPENCYESDEALLAQGKLADLMVVATQDRQHAGIAIAAMKLGYDILCEKPVSPFADECLAVEQTAQETGRRVIVCHVLRYSLFFLTIKHIIESGEIGEVVALEMTEKVGYWHQAHSYVRGNWRSSIESSPMILAKSCHDMDLILWLTNKHCISVNSIGNLKHFKRSNAPAGASEHCTVNCPEYETCPYSVEKSYLRKAREEHYFLWPTSVVTHLGTLEDLQNQLAEGPYGRCVYHCDNDVVDHQHVNLLLEDDVTASFTMSAFTSGTGRRIHVMGTKGDIIGELNEAKVVVTKFGSESVTLDTTIKEFEQYGHGGGDLGVVKETIAVLNGNEKNTYSITSIENSIESHLTALAAEESRLHGGDTVRLDDYVKEVKSAKHKW